MFSYVFAFLEKFWASVDVDKLWAAVKTGLSSGGVGGALTAIAAMSSQISPEYAIVITTFVGFVSFIGHSLHIKIFEPVPVPGIESNAVPSVTVAIEEVAKEAVKEVVAEASPPK
jgi:hypothetical protein